MSTARPDSRNRLLDAAIDTFRAHGYAATRVEDICDAAGLTKGSFFHHFPTKEDLTVAAVERWSSNADTLFRTAAYQQLPDPFDRLIAYVDFRIGLIRGDLPEFTCLIGTLVQETWLSNPRIRAACDDGIGENVAMLATDIAAAMRQRGITADWTPVSLAAYSQAVIQGAFILAKTSDMPQIAVECLLHLRRYLQSLFSQQVTQ